MNAVLTPSPAALMPNTKGLTRDEETHTYYWQGRVVPGITRLMEPIHSYDSVPDWILERKADLGRQVHYACELWDLDDLIEESLDPSIVPYLAAYKDFRKQHTGRIHAIEPLLYHASMGYAGQPDRDMELDTPNDVVEIKTTSQLWNAVGVQLAAQEHLIKSCNPARKPGGKRFALQLKADGKFTLREYKAPTDWPTFVSLLTTANWIARFGGK